MAEEQKFIRFAHSSTSTHLHTRESEPLQEVFFAFEDCHGHDSNPYDQEAVEEVGWLRQEKLLRNRPVREANLRPNDDSKRDQNRPCAERATPGERGHVQVTNVEAVEDFQHT